MKPFAHQVKYAKGYKDKELCAHEGGTGKTICACLWLKDGRDSDALVVCPLKVVKKWQATLKIWGTKATVLSKEDFKKHPLKQWSARVIDEVDEFASPLFIAKLRSDLSTKLYEQVDAYPDTPTLLLSATPIRSTPWNLHSILTFKGHYVEWKKWRTAFFDLVYPDNGKYRYLSRPAYMPKENWRELIRPVLEKYADIVLFKDCVDVLPPVTVEKISVKTPKYVRALEDKPFYDEHRHEQQNKLKEILEYGKRFRKVIVVAFYTEQVEELAKQLAKDKPTFCVMGGVKGQEDIILKAQATDDCYLVMQASIGVGSDCDTFPCLIFTSMSYSVRDLVQMKFRVRRIHNLNPVKHVYLFGGRCDKAVFEHVEKGKTFVPSEWHDSIKGNETPHTA